MLMDNRKPSLQIGQILRAVQPLLVCAMLISCGMPPKTKTKGQSFQRGENLLLELDGLDKSVECNFIENSEVTKPASDKKYLFAVIQGSALAICLSENGHDKLASKVALDVLILSEMNGLYTPSLETLSSLVENNVDYSNSLRSWARWVVVRDSGLDDFETLRSSPRHIQSMNGTMLAGERFFAENLIAGAQVYLYDQP